MNWEAVTRNILNVMVGMLLVFAAVWHFSAIAPLPRYAMAFVAALLVVTTCMVYWMDGNWTEQGTRTAIACYKTSRMTILMSALAVWELYKMATVSPEDKAITVVFTFSIWTLLALVAGLLLCFVTMVVVTFFKPTLSARMRV
jgi:hypothetical protein